MPLPPGSRRPLRRDPATPNRQFAFASPGRLPPAICARRFQARGRTRVGLPVGVLAAIRGFSSVLLLLGAVRLSAQSAPGKQSGPPDNTMVVRGVFDTPLPTTEPRGRLRVTARPPIGDLLDRDYLRLPIEGVLGLTRIWDLTADATGFFSHGLGSESLFHEVGLASAHVGTKYRLGDLFGQDWDTAIGGGYTTPVDHPPADSTDGLRHTRSFLTLAHPLPNHPQIRFFSSVIADVVRVSSVAGQIQENELRQNNLRLAAGLVWDRPRVRYSLEAVCATTRLIGHTNHDVFGLYPGIIVKIPERFTYCARGEWMAGLAAKAEIGPDGSHFGLSGKIRINFEFNRLLHRRSSPLPNAPKPPVAAGS
ncbi:MAG TPA: hypothetical protein VLT83_03485 [Opitutaceae bacterium]|nr:hypothetical protein [Opitutaceae bacterium]